MAFNNQNCCEFGPPGDEMAIQEIQDYLQEGKYEACAQMLRRVDVANDKAQATLQNMKRRQHGLKLNFFSICDEIQWAAQDYWEPKNILSKALI